MLFIIFGTFGNLGNKTRHYLSTVKGIKEVEKFTYIPKEAVASQFFSSPKNLVSKADVKKCTYTYELSISGTNEKRSIGFYFSDIDEAVSGKTDFFITLSAENFDFIKKLKSTFMGHVSVICVYVEESAMQGLLDEYGLIDESIKQTKIEINRKIKKILITDRYFFDDIVAYSNCGILKNDESLFKQYDVVISKAKEREKIENDETYVELPYKGNLPFVFVSYARADYDDFVQPALQILQNNYCRTWYDKDGISGGEDWENILKSKIKDCGIMLLFSSKRSTRKNSFVSLEIHYACFCNKPIIRVCIDDSLFGAPLEKSLEKKQHFNYDLLTLEKKLIDAIKACNPDVFKSTVEAVESNEEEAANSIT